WAGPAHSRTRKTSDRNRRRPARRPDRNSRRPEPDCDRSRRLDRKSRARRKDPPGRRRDRRAQRKPQAASPRTADRHAVSPSPFFSPEAARFLYMVLFFNPVQSAARNVKIGNSGGQKSGENGMSGEQNGRWRNTILAGLANYIDAGSIVAGSAA